MYVKANSHRSVYCMVFSLELTIDFRPIPAAKDVMLILLLSLEGFVEQEISDQYFL